MKKSAGRRFPLHLWYPAREVQKLLFLFSCSFCSFLKTWKLVAKANWDRERQTLCGTSHSWSKERKADKIRKERKRSMLFQMISIIVYSNVLYCCKGKPFFRLQSLVTVNICSLYTIQYNETLRLSVKSTKRSRLERKVHVHFSSNKGKSKYQLSYFQYKSCISLWI